MDIINMFRYGSEKLIATVPTCFLTLHVEDKNILAGVVFIVILDTILGVWCSFEYKRFDSHKLRRLITKIGQYGIALLSAWVLAAVEHELFGWFFRGTGIFIILTELISNFEKLALLGMKLPTKLIARVNKEYEKMIEGDGKEAEEIMDKRDKLL